jgi:sirohydrochlorin ferrochelatase
MTLIVVAHGTRRSYGLAMIADLAEQVSTALDGAVYVGFVDVLGPTPSELLSVGADAAAPAIVVPAFLSRGYHVRLDLPAHITASGHPDVTVTPALGPSPRVARILADQLGYAGWCPGDSVVLAAVGTSDPTARADLSTTAALLAALVRSPVKLAFAAAGSPSVRDAVLEARRGSARRVVVASYLLADGLFQEQLKSSGADAISEPLGTHPDLVRLVADRFQAARTPIAV